MTFLLRERKDVLLEVAKELRVEIDITLPKIEFKKRICQSKYYDEESVKCLLEGILEEKREECEEREKQEIKEYEERRQARELKERQEVRELKERQEARELKAGNRINELANVCILSGKHTAEFRDRFTGKRDRSTIYRLNLIKLYRRKPELADLVMKNSSEGIDSETLYSVKLFMDVGFQGNLRKSQLYFKLPPDRSSYLRMINAKKKERFLPGPKTIVLRQKDTNLVTGKPFRIKTCCSSQMLINSLREDTEYLLDLGVNGMGSQTVLCPLFGGTLNSHRAASPLVRLVDGEEMWEAPGHSQAVLPQNWGETELNHSLTCMVLKAMANDRRH
ncbi:uncharacterized protein TNCV_3962881 [Trichonephila clavipes]|nr:uncharacterized protein TNCV_3962881 [Trichonephila clavipes]